MAKIKLINENGVIKGIDPETGEEVPVEFEDLETQSVSTEAATINGYPASFGLSSGDTTTEHFGDEISIPGDTYHTVFDVGSAVDVIAGSIHGPAATEIRVTWDDGTTTKIYETVVMRGRTQADAIGDRYTALSVPYLHDVTTLEFKNDGSKSGTFGYGVVTTP